MTRSLFAPICKNPITIGWDPGRAGGSTVPGTSKEVTPVEKAGVRAWPRTPCVHHVRSHREDDEEGPWSVPSTCHPLSSHHQRRKHEVGSLLSSPVLCPVGSPWPLHTRQHPVLALLAPRSTCCPRRGAGTVSASRCRS